MNQLSSHPPEHSKPASLEAQYAFIQKIIEGGSRERFEVIFQAKDHQDLDPKVRDFIKKQLLLADSLSSHPKNDADRERRRPDKPRAPRPRSKRKRTGTQSPSN